MGSQCLLAQGTACSCLEESLVTQSLSTVTMVDLLLSKFA